MDRNQQGHGDLCGHDRSADGESHAAHALADRLDGISPSATLALSAQAAALKAQGRDIINMGVGEPDFETPELVRIAAQDAMNNGHTRYTATAGTQTLREAICAKLKRENNLPYSPNEIVVSNGAKQAIHNIVSALINPGDEVIVPSPYWVSYTDVVKLCGGINKIIRCTLKDGFRLQPSLLANQLGPRSKLIFINSPNNPTGAMYSRRELEALGEVLRQYPHVWILSDDIYEHVLVGEQPMLNIVNACPDLAHRTIVVNGVSKAYAMTGWRIGYAACVPHLAKALETVQSQTTGSPNAIAQAAAMVALSHSSDLIAPMATAYRERHALMCDRLAKIEGLKFLPSAGSFYVFVQVQQIIENLYAKKLLEFESDVSLSSLLLERAGLAVVPGSAFGAPGHLRLSFATSIGNIEKACDRLRAVCEL